MFDNNFISLNYLNVPLDKLIKFVYFVHSMQNSTKNYYL